MQALLTAQSHLRAQRMRVLQQEHHHHHHPPPPRPRQSSPQHPRHRRSYVSCACIELLNSPATALCSGG
jgi:hypothetical protein